MEHPIQRLPDAQLEVMQALWRCVAPAAREDIEQVLFQTHPMAVTTLLTLLTRMEEKGYVTIERKGRKSYYWPNVTEEDYIASQSRTFFEKVCGGRLSTFANALCDSGLSREDLAELRSLLEREEL